MEVGRRSPALQSSCPPDACLGYEFIHAVPRTRVRMIAVSVCWLVLPPHRHALSQRPCCDEAVEGDGGVADDIFVTGPELIHQIDELLRLPLFYSKQYAGRIAEKIEGAVNKHLEKNPPTETETPTESIGQVSGKRRALLIGINYFGQKEELSGCINDVKNIKRFLTQFYRLDQVLILTDDQKDPRFLPTRANILDGFRWLRNGARAGDSLILHYSGHGGSVMDTDGDEEDGRDETLIPVDHKTAGHIVDDEIHDVLVRGLPKGVRLTGIMDCCHSGSMLDLPYTYDIDGDLVITENERSKGISRMVAAGTRIVKGDGRKRDAMRSITEGMKMAMSSSGADKEAARERTIQTRSTVADVVQFSGCKDSQTSADATIGGQATGAMSFALISALISALKENKDMTYTELLKRMRQILEKKYTQVPQMSAGRKLDLNSTFSL